MEKSDPRHIILKYPYENGKYSSADAETWLFLIEQSLAYEYEDYEVSVNQNNYSQIISVEILFSKIEDAMLFRLKMCN